MDSLGAPDPPQTVASICAASSAVRTPTPGRRERAAQGRMRKAPPSSARIRMARTCSVPSCLTSSQPVASPRVQRWLDEFSHLSPKDKRKAIAALAAIYPTLFPEHLRVKRKTPSYAHDPTLLNGEGKTVGVRDPSLDEDYLGNAPQSLERAVTESPESVNETQPSLGSHAPESPIGCEKQLASASAATKKTQTPHTLPRQSRQLSPRSLTTNVASVAVQTPPKPSHGLARSARTGSAPSALPFQRLAKRHSERDASTPVQVSQSLASSPHRVLRVSPSTLQALHETVTISSYLRQMQKNNEPNCKRVDAPFEVSGGRASFVHNVWLAGLRPSNNLPLPANTRPGKSTAEASAISVEKSGLG